MFYRKLYCFKSHGFNSDRELHRLCINIAALQETRLTDLCVNETTGFYGKGRRLMNSKMMAWRYPRCPVQIPNRGTERRLTLGMATCGCSEFHVRLRPNPELHCKGEGPVLLCPSFYHLYHTYQRSTLHHGRLQHSKSWCGLWSLAFSNRNIMGLRRWKATWSVLQ